MAQVVEQIVSCRRIGGFHHHVVTPKCLWARTHLSKCISKWRSQLGRAVSRKASGLRTLGVICCAADERRRKKNNSFLLLQALCFKYVLNVIAIIQTSRVPATTAVSTVSAYLLMRTAMMVTQSFDSFYVNSSSNWVETGSQRYLTVPLQQQQHVGVSSLHTKQTHAHDVLYSQNTVTHSLLVRLIVCVQYVHVNRHTLQCTWQCECDYSVGVQ